MESQESSKKVRVSGLRDPFTEDQKVFCDAFGDLVASLGEVMPHQTHKDRYGNPGSLILLPSALYGKKAHVFQDLSSIHSLPEGMKEKYFKILWRRYFPNVVLKRWNPFAKCDTCTRFRQLIQRIPRKYVDIHKSIKVQQKQHREQVTVFRRRIMDRDELAETQPSQFLKILVDGMDSKKCQTPRLGSDATFSKDLSSTGKQ
jgi:hypothetical protein